MWFSFLLLHHHCALIGPFYTDLSIPYGHLLFSVFEISGLGGGGRPLTLLKVRWLKVCMWIFHIYHIITYCLEINLVSWATIKNLRSREDRSIGPSKFTLQKKKKAWFSDKKNTELSRSLLSFIGCDHMLVLSVS